MTIPAKQRANSSRRASTLRASVSLATLAFTSGVLSLGQAQTITSAANNQIIAIAAGTTTTVDGAPVIVVANDDVTVDNAGTIATTGITQTVDILAVTTGATINNAATGVITADSRAVQINGDGATLNNAGTILGTGNQRNGTVYTNATATDFTLNNTGTIDAGPGHQGAGFSAETVADGTVININNSGTIQGRGQAPAGATTAGDGIRFERTRVAGALDGTTTGLVTGTITNSGTINSESTQGTTAGIRFVNGVSFSGTIDNSGTISGAQNGLYFGNATPAGGGDFTGAVVNNTGTISSGSRALNIDGTGLTVNNSGSIVGTGNQRNGTAYADGTADNFTVNNSGTIDASAGNTGSGFGAEIGSAADGANTFTLNNSGIIQGRGDAAAGTTAAGDGVRIGNPGNTGIAEATIINSGSILSEGANGTVAGLRVVDGVGFQGTLTNEEAGTISGVQNGVYFGNGDHTGGVVNNAGEISSGSRAFNIDGTGLTVNNSGSIVGTGNQRNGTLYADGTADNFTVNNQLGGVIDAGEGNTGSGFGVEIGSAADGANTFTLVNDGTIQGRGDAAANTTAAGDGIRIGNPGNVGIAEATITNTGTIASEGENGTVAGVRFVNGVSFAGTFDNSGTISGVQNGVYFGNPVDGEGADHSNGVFNNLEGGVISSGSRAFNVDGTGLTVNNAGTILGTGDQRNGTFYADDTANNYTLNNSGTIDAGEGNQGAGVSLSLGADPVTATINNSGTIQGRTIAGDPLAPTSTLAGDGLRFEGIRGTNADGGVTFAPAEFDGIIVNSGTISSGDNVSGSTAGVHFVNGVSFTGTLTNEATGVISGAANGLYFGNPVGGEGADHTGGVVNNLGRIESGSRAVNIDGIGLVLNNSGTIIGTADQRNGTVYADLPAQNFTLNNLEDGVIDAGEGNNGAGFSAQLDSVANGGNDFTINNDGIIQGRGNVASGATTAGDGIRFERTRVDGALDGTTTGLFTGTINNTGSILSESTTGTTAGLHFVNGVSFQGTINNSGTIAGAQNGVYFGNPVAAGGSDHTGGVFNNLVGGIVSSDSRAFNIDGLGLTVNNAGSIVGTGNQRNGTLYADGTADNFTVNNQLGGVIDAGEGNTGSGFGVEIGGAADGANTFTLVNDGTIQGRGDAAAGTTAAGDGIRIGNPGNIGIAEATITNTGTIASEGANGTVAGVRFVNGVSFAGTFDNSGTISGVQNGVYFGNPVDGEGADHSNGVFNNLVGGVVSSGSRAFNIDGTGLTVNNAGSILGTGNQRNGTLYADGTAQNFTVNNSGSIDAGEGLDGSGFAAEIGADGNSFTFDNSGTIQGRGQGTFSDGFRVGNGGNIGVATVAITNSGTISSESTGAGAVSGLRFVNGVSFAGTIDNSGTISGAQNGLYFGNPVDGEGADHSNGVVNNLEGGVISSGSRAFNVDGLGLTVNNAGSILGTGDQRNGTFYADATADNYTLNNLATGVIDAGAGNNGSGISLQLGAVDGDTRTISITNDGTVSGRGEALPSGQAAGLRLFSSVAGVTVNGDITNTGTISSETAPAILIEGVNYTGTITNSGVLDGTAAFDASAALGAISFVNNGGSLNGNFIGSSFADTLTLQGASTLAGSILGGVATTFDTGSVTTVSGAQTLEGDLTANGTLNFVLGADSLAVDGNSTLGASSIVNVTTNGDVTQTVLNTPVSVISETGTFTNNGVTVNVIEDDFLVDYDVVLGSVTVTATAADLAAVSADTNISAFGGALTSAFAAGQLDAGVANILNDVTNATGFEDAALSLLPAINEGATREVFESHGLVDQFVERRLASDAQRGVWVQGFGRTAVRATEGRSSPGYDADAFGLAIGADTKVGENLTVGASFNYANIDIDSAGITGQETELDSFQLATYAGYRSGAAFINGQLGYVFGNGDSTRTGVTGPITGDADVDGFTAQASAGYNIQNGAWTLTPQAGLRFASLSQDDFTEAGGLGLDVDAESVQYLDARIGADVAGNFGGFKPFARVGYVYDLIGDETVFDVNFAGATGPFTLESADPAQSRFEIGTGFAYDAGNGFSIGIEYDGEFSGDYQSHGGFVRARIAF